MAIVPYLSYSIRPLYHKNPISTSFYSSLLTKTESFTFVLFPRRTANTSAFLWNFYEDTVSFSQRTYLFIYSFVPSVFYILHEMYIDSPWKLTVSIVDERNSRNFQVQRLKDSAVCGLQCHCRPSETDPPHSLQRSSS